MTPPEAPSAAQSDRYMQVRACGYDDGPHEYPDDWIFGGSRGTHPGADPRYQPSVYTYYDQQLHAIWTTVVPLCDEEAIDQFTFVANISPGFNPVFLSVRRPDSDKQEMLPVQYEKSTDTAWDFIRA